MNCQQAEKSVYLFKAGELRKAEVQQLNEHIEGCAYCASLMANMHEIQTFTEKLREATSEIKEIRATDTIISEINDLGRHNSPVPKVAFLQRKFVRYALTSAALLLMGLFAYQQYEIKQNIAELNNRLNTQNSMATSPEVNSRKRLVQFKRVKENFNTDQLNDREVQQMLHVLKNDYPDLYKEIKNEIQQKGYEL